MSKAAQAIAALRAGRAVTVGTLTVAAVETATDDLLAMLDPEGSAPILLSGERASAIGLGNQREAANSHAPVVIARRDWLDARAVRALVDPAQDFGRFSAGPLASEAPGDLEAARGALVLARLAGLMPALWVLPAQAALAVESSEATKAASRSHVSIVSRAQLPVNGLEVPTQIVVMRAEEDGSEHVALLVGAPGGRPPLVRLHSECLTGDVFGSLKCDCGPQLRAAMQLMEQEGAGILLYLRQEGRGIGLANKIRAYALQDRGLDTVEANLRLGFGDDERDFGLAAAMLRALGVSEVRLMTNNPAKLEGLAQAGIVATRVPHHLPTNPHNAHYLATKKAKSGHLD
ncbi:GTP cyclohydrolase II [Sphingomonas rosea]|uniref:GTP cyclohydrolase-2 n=1 Tax=Sphingomonas rosea TaxID=335605 RepID=A0ABP7TUL4_9SPHN